MTELYPYLILVGLSILAATAWLLYVYRKQALHSRALIQLNEKLGYDLPDFLRHCWTTLEKGGFSGLTWELDWFGTHLSDRQGQASGRVIEKKFDVQEISLLLRIYSNHSRWEQRYFTDALAENFFLLVRMNLWIKLGTVQGAFEQSAKMVVFLQHDVKNLVQLISLATEQLERPHAGQEQKILQQLQTTLPSVRDRARHMLDTLSNAQMDVHTSELQLETMLEATAHMYNLPVEVHGSARLNTQADRLQNIMDNLFTNYSRQQHKKNQSDTDLQIHLLQEHNQVRMRMRDNNGLPCDWPERLFEPFWSEHGTGRGIGLYQARQQALSIGGSLTAEAETGEPLTFYLNLPGNL